MLLARVRSSRRPEEAPADTRAAFVSRITDPGWRRRVPRLRGRGGEGHAESGRDAGGGGADRRTRPPDTPAEALGVPSSVSVGSAVEAARPPRLWRDPGRPPAEVRGEFGEGEADVGRG